MAPPRSDFAQILPMLRESPRKVNREKQFIRGQYVALVAGVELGVGDAAFAPHRNQFNLRIVDQQCRRRVCGRRSIHQIAAEGGAALVGDGADPTCGFGQQGELRRNEPHPLANR